MRNAASIALGASVGSMKRAAKNVPITALKLISPRPSVTGSHQHEDPAHRRVAPVDREAQAAVAARAATGTGSSTWITVPTTIEPA